MLRATPRRRTHVVSLAAEPAALRARITDDGAGFEPSEDQARSLGLSGMIERASLVGGDVAISSAPGQGTTVVLEVPIE